MSLNFGEFDACAMQIKTSMPFIRVLVPGMSFSAVIDVSVVIGKISEMDLTVLLLILQIIAILFNFNCIISQYVRDK